MNGDTPINCYEQQFSQREASELSGVEMTTINNWLLRGEYSLEKSQDKRLRGRRFFSIADIAALHTMDFCIRHLDMRPAAASVAGRVVYQAFQDGTIHGDADKVNNRQFVFWHIMHKSFLTTIGDIDGWSIQRVWQDRNKGTLHAYDPVSYPDEEAFGLPHYPSLQIPTTELARRIFNKCTDYLMTEEGSSDGGTSKE